MEIPVKLFAPREIREGPGLARGDLDLVLGGPPCQGFSTYGQRDPDDHRNRLYRNFLS
jgi:DNA (cytosine-5)-methyltransferase 1